MPRHYAPHETALLYRARDVVEATLLVAHLEADGIPAWTVGSGACFAFGDAPADTLLVDVRVPREHHARAIELVHAYFADGEDGTPWTCAACGEAVEGGFVSCWSCGAERSAEAAPAALATEPRLPRETPEALMRGFFVLVGVGALCVLATFESRLLLQHLGLDPKAVRLVLTVLVPLTLLLAKLLLGRWVLGSRTRDRREELGRPARRF
ncbi:MAG: hypothetical protein H6828_16490 [Planctomycetes bacterium]|nr:hypothetical protein [Planctomycetota bacterium]